MRFADFQQLLNFGRFVVPGTGIVADLHHDETGITRVVSRRKRGGNIPKAFLKNLIRYFEASGYVYKGIDKEASGVGLVVQVFEINK